MLLLVLKHGVEGAVFLDAAVGQHKAADNVAGLVGDQQGAVLLPGDPGEIAAEVGRDAGQVMGRQVHDAVAGLDVLFRQLAQQDEIVHVVQAEERFSGLVDDVGDHILLGLEDAVLALHLGAGFAAGQDILAQSLGVGHGLGVDLVAFRLGLGQDLGAFAVGQLQDLGGAFVGVAVDLFNDFF